MTTSGRLRCGRRRRRRERRPRVVQVLLGRGPALVARVEQTRRTMTATSLSRRNRKARGSAGRGWRSRTTAMSAGVELGIGRQDVLVGGPLLQEPLYCRDRDGVPANVGWTRAPGAASRCGRAHGCARLRHGGDRPGPLQHDDLGQHDLTGSLAAFPGAIRVQEIEVVPLDREAQLGQRPVIARRSRLITWRMCCRLSLPRSAATIRSSTSPAKSYSRTSLEPRSAARPPARPARSPASS